MTTPPIDTTAELIEKAHAFRSSLGDAEIKPETIDGLWLATAEALEPHAAAMAEVLALHRKVTRWGDEDGEYSLSQEDYDDSPEDYTHLRPFDVCAECFRIEQSPEQHDDEMPHSILEGLYPCPTRQIAINHGIATEKS